MLNFGFAIHCPGLVWVESFWFAPKNRSNSDEKLQLKCTAQRSFDSIFFCWLLSSSSLLFYLANKLQSNTHRTVCHRIRFKFSFVVIFYKFSASLSMAGGTCRFQKFLAHIVRCQRCLFAKLNSKFSFSLFAFFFCSFLIIHQGHFIPPSYQAKNKFVAIFSLLHEQKKKT